MQDLARGQRPVRVELGEVSYDFASSPPGSRLAELECCIEHVGLRRMRTRMRPVRAVEQSVWTLQLVALEPLIALLATDAMSPAQLGVRKHAALGLQNESLAFGHGIGLQPWHRQLRKTRHGAARSWGDCHPSGVTKV